MILQPNEQPNASRFWWQWFLVGGGAGMFAGLVLRLLIIPFILWILSFYGKILLLTIRSVFVSIGVFIVLGGVYSLGQGVAQYVSLNAYIPRMRRSLRANFIGTVVGVIVTGILFVVLLLAGLGTFLEQLGLSSAFSLILQAFIVGGFGGIAQAIVARWILGQDTEAGYFRWIVPLALLGHVSGGLVGIVALLLTSPFFA
jgi:hypothetical protein